MDIKIYCFLYLKLKLDVTEMIVDRYLGKYLSLMLATVYTEKVTSTVEYN